MVEKISDSIIKIAGKIDSNNAKQFEQELLSAADGLSEATLDAAELEYISSAGLRALLRLKKTLGATVNIVNVSPEIYDIFEVTGFSNILNVKKAIREISVEGCEIIGQGGNGTVYRLDDDTIVKVYRPSVSLDKIEKEREYAKNALISGVPCVIAYDVVKCGDSYGIVFEMIRSDTLGHAMVEEPERFDEYMDKYVALAKELHSATLADGVRIKDELHERVPNLKPWCTEEEMELLHSLIEEMPDEECIIHGDFHPGNIMIQDGELLLIDMPEVTVGPEIWELTAIYRDLVAAPSNFQERVRALMEKSTGMPVELLKKTGISFFERYMGIDEKEIEELFKKLGLMYALNVVFVLASGSPQSLDRAEPIVEHLLRGVVVPNEQALRHILKMKF